MILALLRRSVHLCKKKMDKHRNKQASQHTIEIILPRSLISFSPRIAQLNGNISLLTAIKEWNSCLVTNIQSWRIWHGRFLQIYHSNNFYDYYMTDLIQWYYYIILSVPGLFTVGLLAVGHFAVGRFAVRILRRTDTLPWGHFSVNTLRRETFCRTDTSP